MNTRSGILSRIIAGPCSAESESQLLQTAQAIKDLGLEWFRAGIWKPRTHPGCFEGVGEKGLEWLRSVKEATGLKICTEAAGAQQAEACLKAGVDMIWIGARTTANPFQVQEIADALGGSGVKVFVKNPVTPDNELWAGAIERLRLAGVKDISVVHRGFSTFEKTRYRNAPRWDKAVEFRMRFPEVPFYCDPSHIAGDTALIGEIAQKAMDLGLDGLMIETHCNPEQALSDSKQQLTPSRLQTLLQNLKLRNTDTDEQAYQGTLARLREKIDSLDENLLDILSERMELSREIGRLKRENNVAVLQSSRWDEVLGNAVEAAQKKNLDTEFITRILNEIHDASVAEQNLIISEL